MVETPNQVLLVFAQIQPLIRLVSAYHLQGCPAICPLLLLHQKRPIRTAQQAGCTGNHLKAVSRRLLSGVVDDQNADAIPISKLLQLADYLIIAGVYVDEADLEAEKIDTAELIAGVMKRIVAAGVGMRLFLRTYRRNEATLYLNTGAAISSRMTIRPPVINRRASSTIYLNSYAYELAHITIRPAY